MKPMSPFWAAVWERVEPAWMKLDSFLAVMAWNIAFTVGRTLKAWNKGLNEGKEDPEV